jgi:hypothetical protein
MFTPTGTPDKIYRPTKQVARRYNRCTRTIDRWLRQGIFPAPDLIVNDKRFWLDNTLDAFDVQQRAAAREIST